MSNGLLRTNCVGDKLHEWIYSLNEYLPSNNEYSTTTSQNPQVLGTCLGT